MKINDNFRIVRIDQYNFIFEVYRETFDKKGNSKGMAWDREYKYYSSLDSCINGIVKYLKYNMVEECKSVEQMLLALKNTHLQIELVNNGRIVPYRQENEDEE